MGIQIMQTCDRCHTGRTLAQNDQHHREISGWRDYSARGITVTLCNVCTDAMVQAVDKGLDWPCPPVSDESTDGPHSRACGPRRHPHGMECSPDCPTCHRDNGLREHRGHSAHQPCTPDCPGYAVWRPCTCTPEDREQNRRCAGCPRHDPAGA